MATRKVKKLPAQAIWDLAIQEYGDIDGAFKILRDNPSLSLDGNIPDGTEIFITEAPINQDVVNFMIHNDIKPAHEHIPLPQIFCSTLTLPNFSNTQTGQLSASQNYQVSAVNLTAPLIITAPTGYIINLNGGTTNQSPIFISPVGGSVPATTIYVRFSPSVSGNISGNVSNNSIGAAPQNVGVDGLAYTPVINTSVTSLTFNSRIPTTISPSMTYTVDGNTLSSPIVITAPSGFILNLDNSNTNASPISLSPVSGNVATTTIYVKFNPALAQTYSGNITHTTNVGISKNISLIGAGAYPSVTGGSQFMDGKYQVVEILSTQNMTWTAAPDGATNFIQYEAFAGGAGGGYETAGGGGAGGHSSGFLTPIIGTYAAIIGAGGAGGTNYGNATNGSDSSFMGITVNGGGHGGDGSQNNAATGGAGGGGGRNVEPGANGISGQGFNGGNGGPGTGTDIATAAGGGGVGGNGLNGSAGGAGAGGQGGAGITITITGTSQNKGGGGGGGIYSDSRDGGNGGSGGGGKGGGQNAGVNATVNTGGGGGGGGLRNTGTSDRVGGNGGSGYWCLRFKAID